jgi:hypothetical protein
MIAEMRTDVARKISQKGKEMSRIYANHELEWKGDRLIARDGSRSAPSVAVISDSNWPGMWRVKRPDGSVTDMLNRARARDAARSILLAIFNGQETRPGARPGVLRTRSRSSTAISRHPSKPQPVRYRQVAR